MAEQDYMSCPVKAGERLSVRIRSDDKVKDRDYFTKIEGFIIFIKGATEDDEGRVLSVRVTGVKDRFGFGRVER